MAGPSRPGVGGGKGSDVLRKLLVKPLPDAELAAGDQAADDDSDHSYQSLDQYSDHQEEGQSESEQARSRRGSKDTSTSKDSQDSKISQSRHSHRRRSTPSGASDSGENDGNDLDEGEPGLKRKKYEQLVESEDSADESEKKETAAGSNPLTTASSVPARGSRQNPVSLRLQEPDQTHERRDATSEIASPDPSPDSANNPPTPEPVHVSNTSGIGES
jgi:hypothetical protein